MSREDSEELTQETFLTLHMERSKFEGRSSLDTFVFGIAKNRWLMHLRAQNSQKRRANESSLDVLMEQQGEIPGPAQNPLEISLRGEDLEQMRTVILGLPQRQRLCLMLRGQGLRYQEIATVLNVGVDLVRSSLFEGKRRLRRQLAEVRDRASFQTKATN